MLRSKQMCFFRPCLGGCIGQYRNVKLGQARTSSDNLGHIKLGQTQINSDNLGQSRTMLSSDKLGQTRINSDKLVPILSDATAQTGPFLPRRPWVHLSLGSPARCLEKSWVGRGGANEEIRLESPRSFSRWGGGILDPGLFLACTGIPNNSN